MANSIIGANNSRLEVLDNTNVSEGGLGTVIGTYHVVSSFQYTRNTTMDPVPQLGTSKTIRVRGVDNNTFQLGVTPAIDPADPNATFNDRVAKMSQLIGKTNLTIFIHQYQEGKADSPDRDNYKLVTWVYNGVSVSSETGSLNAGNTQTSVNLSGEFESLEFISG